MRCCAVKRSPACGAVPSWSSSSWCGYCRTKSATLWWIRPGLAGSYEFTLQWKPDDTAASQKPTFGGAQGAAGTASGPSIVTAIQEQLGLELEPQEVPREVLVIDHVE